MRKRRGWSLGTRAASSSVVDWTTVLTFDHCVCVCLVYRTWVLIDRTLTVNAHSGYYGSTHIRNRAHGTTSTHAFAAPRPSHGPVTSSDKRNSAMNAGDRPDTSSPNWPLCVFMHILIQNGLLVSGLSLAFLPEVTGAPLIG